MTHCFCGDKIGYCRFNMGAQISLSLLSFHLKMLSSSDLLTLLSQGKIQCGAFAGYMKESCLVAKYIKDNIITKGETGYLCKMQKEHIKYLGRTEREL